MRQRPHAALIALIAAATALPVLLLVLGGGLADRPACPSGADPSPQSAVAGLEPDQLRVAEQVVLAVRAFPGTADRPHAAVIALATARQESGLRNLTYGDQDSLGVFQQRPSQGWGTPAQILDIAHATTSFLDHLVKVPDWETLPVTDAAADVQSPAPENRGLYQQWVPLALDLTQSLWPNANPGAISEAKASTSNRICLAAGLISGGAVTYPVPADLADTDRHNWGGHGDHWASWHTGTDFSVPCGTPVLASTGGTVEIQPGPDWYGNWLVKVVTGPDSLATWYAHMQRLTVTAGASVTAGQQLGEVGDLGNTTGCHLHFEVHLHNGPIYGSDNVDPSAWLAHHVGQQLGANIGVGDATGATQPGVARVATFNTLGDSHTAPGGNSSNHIDGTTRMRWTVQALTEHQVDIVGMQEFEPTQESAFTDLTAGTWAHFPESDGKPGAANVVAWRTDRWSAVAAGRTPIPYFHGDMVQMPFVLLQNQQGDRVWVISVHNPADTRGPAQQWRDAAVQAEINLIDQLGADGTPVTLTGDMNDRATFYCAITSTATTTATTTAAAGTAGSPVHAANGGQPGDPCRPPAAMGIDWILGTLEVTFSGYSSTRQPPIDRASDHPLVFADVTLP